MNSNTQHQQNALIEELRRQGISNEKILQAFASTPRHHFVSPRFKRYAYEDTALPIDCQQTISQPFVVALMTEIVYSAKQFNKVLEIGTGSGYQAAILSKLAKQVYTVERINTLLEQAKMRFDILKLTNIDCKYADGTEGWPEHAPYDAIIVTAAAVEIPQALLDQLADGGKMIIPVEVEYFGQELQLITRRGDEYQLTKLDSVIFVPLLTGKE